MKQQRLIDEERWGQTPYFKNAQQHEQAAVIDYARQHSTERL